MSTSLGQLAMNSGYRNHELPISGPSNGIKRPADSPSSNPADVKRPKMDGPPGTTSAVSTPKTGPAPPLAAAPPSAASTTEPKVEMAPLRILIRANPTTTNASNGSGVGVPNFSTTSPELSNTPSQASSEVGQVTSQPQQRKRLIQLHDPYAAASGNSVAVPHRVLPQSLVNSGIEAKHIGPYQPIPGRHFEVQDGRCLKRDYLAASRCTACVNKQARTDCLFHGFRTFVLPEPPYNAIAEDTPTFFATFSTPTLPLTFPTNFNRSYTASDQQVLSVSAAHALMPTIERSLKHANLPRAVRRPSDHRDRHVCDFCLTSFFFSYYFCGECGREYCEDCFESIKRYLPSTGRPLHATDPQTAVDMSVKAQAEAEKSVNDEKPLLGSPAAARPTKMTNGSGGGRLTNVSSHAAGDYARLPPEVEVSKGRISDARIRRMLGCCGGRLHSVDFMIPVTTKSKKDLEVLLQQMREDVLTVKPERLFGDTSYRTGLSTEDRSIHRQRWDAEPKWDPVRPLVIEGLQERLEIDWSPASFASAFSKMSCEIQECFSGLIRRSKVSDFFGTFGKKRTAQDGIWKLKDWPPTADFATWQPDLFEEFMKVVPFPDITRHDGVRNFGVRFPLKSNKPDLGPKLYCAQSSIDAAGYGTTKLHIDAADAINIMVHCGSDYTRSPEGTPGEALWTIYPPKSSHIVREYCYEILAKLESRPGKEKTVEDVKKYLDDPIHMQQMYLDEGMRRELEHRGARPWTIRQKAGEAVTIPAGCAHQVCNFGDCIKIAVDFVSPESVERCWQTSSEFRQLTKVRAWKEDLLQLKNMIYYTWLACPPPHQKRQQEQKASQEVRSAPMNGAAKPGMTTSAASPSITASAPPSASATNSAPPPAPPSASPAPPASSAPSVPSTHVGRASPVSTSTPSVISLPKLAGPASVPFPARTTSGTYNPLRPPSSLTNTPTISSPMAAKPLLPRLRGRSPSEIVPVLKPGTATSSIRTRPASTLDPLENPPSMVAEPGAPLMLPLDRPESIRPRAAAQQSTWSAFYTRGDPPPELRRDIRGTTDSAFFKHLYG